MDAVMVFERTPRYADVQARINTYANCCSRMLKLAADEGSDNDIHTRRHGGGLLT